jgi:hypothetical protein
MTPSAATRCSIYAEPCLMSVPSTVQFAQLYTARHDHVTDRRLIALSWPDTRRWPAISAMPLISMARKRPGPGGRVARHRRDPGGSAATVGSRAPHGSLVTSLCVMAGPPLVGERRHSSVVGMNPTLDSPAVIPNSITRHDSASFPEEFNLRHPRPSYRILLDRSSPRVAPRAARIHRSSLRCEVAKGSPLRNHSEE